jgi:hypothetical protein
VRRVAIAIVVASGLLGQQATAEAPAFLAWSAQQAETIGRGMYETGRVGGIFDTRMLQTNRSFNYKLAATWLTPDVIRATVRLQQISERLSDAEAVTRVAGAMSDVETTVMVEIDPREGSGVIPLDWVALLEPRAGDARLPTIRGRVVPERRTDPAFAGVMRRNYDYDRFWVAFPLVVDGAASIPPRADHVDLVVRIHDKEGHVTWSLSAAMRAWLGNGTQ